MDFDLNNSIFAHPAAVHKRSAIEATALLELARRVADPEVFEERTPYFWQAEISSDRLDAYFTRMANSTLKNFASDAAAGVSFQDSHVTSKLGFGRSLTGTFNDANSAGVARVLADFYTIPDLNLNGISTNDYILGMRSGLISDVSVGFYGGEFRCSICGQNMMSWDCVHIPGFSYDRIDPETGDVEGQDLAFAWIENARLAEVSAVYEGATPGAAILKAFSESERGRISPRAKKIIEQHYRTHLPDANIIKATPGVPWIQARGAHSLTGAPIGHMEQLETRSNADAPGELIVSNLKEDVTVTEDVVAETNTSEVVEASPTDRNVDPELLGVLQGAGVRSATVGEGINSLLERVRTLASENSQLKQGNARIVELEGEVNRLRPLADDGTAYRNDILAEAMSEGVRALGDSFSEETYRGLLEKAPLASLKRIRDDFRAQADKIFTGGRRTIDEDVVVDEPVAEEKTETPITNRREVPDAAFSS